jgi:putative nucleotidyltransferase with HDIG domain
MANARSTNPRRREMRRQAARPATRPRPQRRRPPRASAAVFAVALALLGTVVALTSEERPYYHLGQILQEPVVPRVSFTAVDRAATENKRQQAREGVYPHYTYNQTLEQRLRKSFDRLLATAGQPSDELESETAERFSLNDATLQALGQYTTDGDPTEAWQKLEDQFIQKLFSMVVLTPDQFDQASEHPIIRIAPPGEGGNQSERNFRDSYQSDWLKLSNTSELNARIQQFVKQLPEPVQQTVLAMTMKAFSPGTGEAQPTYEFAPSLTQQKKDAAEASVEPVPIAFDPTEADHDVIAPAGAQLDETDLYLIEQEREAFNQSLGLAERWLRWLGTFGLFAAVAVGLWAYNFAYNEKLVRNPMRGLALTGLLLLMQLLAGIMTQAQPQFIFFTATLPTLLAVIVLTITYDRRYALGVGAAHAIIVLLTLNLSIGLTLTLLTGVAVAVAQLHDIRTRSKLVMVGVWTGVAMGAIAMLAAATTRPLYIDYAFERLLGDGGWAILAGVSAGLLAQGVLPGIEKLFKVTTAMTLKELNDASHPLLQRLAQEAPGTYQHSLRIADMAESSADAIGADGLLCRVGAMYHDVGKINKPQYFIENQAGGPNRHSKLSPAMSLLIIVGHVKDGIEMAREAGLPPVLRHFIESHHGTTLVEYFYHAARKQQEAEAKPGPSEFEFRYPGPKPQTKEAAILLLCDSVEGAARSLDEPTPVRLDQVVHNMANKRLMDGQFDECNLTLKELARIEQAITKTLCAIYHGRIKYPTGESNQPAANQPTPQARPAVS